MEQVRAFKKLCLDAGNLRKSLIKKRIEYIDVNNSATVPHTDSLQINIKEEFCASDEDSTGSAQCDNNKTNIMQVVIKEEKCYTPTTSKNIKELMQGFEESQEHAGPLSEIKHSVEQLKFTSSDCEMRSIDENNDNFEMENLNFQNTCNQCDYTFTLTEDLIEHSHTVHETYKCEFCEEIFLGSKNFTYHVSNNHNEKLGSFKFFKCPTCKHRFQSAAELYLHYSTHNYSCEFCNQSFKTKGGLTLHRRHRHLKDPSKQIKKDCDLICEICKTRYSSSDTLNQHMIAKHKDPATWKHACTVCDKKFPFKRPYVIHMRRHLGVKPYECKLCDKNYVSKDDLNKHTTAHKNGHPGKCYYCENKYEKRQEMEEHLTNVHAVTIKPAGSNRTKKCVCHVCNKGFYDNHQLSSHMRTHSGEKPFKCQECDKAYVQKADLRHHFQSIHNKFSVTK